MAAPIGEIIRNGVVFDVKNWSTAMPEQDTFLQTIKALFDALTDSAINYLLVGGVALLSYVDGRNTQDIDLILARSDLDVLPGLIIIDENKDLIRGLFNQLQIDILLTQNELFKVVLEQFSSDRPFGTRVVRCATVEGLIILTCYALPSLYRQGQFNRASIYENDLLLLLLNYSVDVQALLKLLSSHLIPSDLHEVEAILDEIQRRIQRFTTQQRSLTDEP